MIKLAFKVKKPILALGAHTKNTLCFAKGDVAYLSRPHQDLNNPADFLDFEKDIKYFLKKNPKIIACDLHPEYQSSKFAQQLSSIPACSAGRQHPVFSIQHHHAHIASCMVDNGLKNQRLIGVAFDGTGLGADGKIWGGEFLICDYKKFTRMAHFKEAPLIGAKKAINEPWRIAAAWLYSLYGEKFLNLNIDFTKGINRRDWKVVKKMYLSGFNSPLTTSAGRLFDAAASIILAKYKADFQAQLPIQLERLAVLDKSKAGGYSFAIAKQKSGYIIGPEPVFRQIVRDLKSGQPLGSIAYRFHLAVAGVINRACLILRKESGINKVALSGGVFANNLLLRLSLDLLYKHKFRVFIHRDFPCSDAGLSLGQMAVANFRRME